MAEVCDGTSAACPGDAFAAAGTICRAPSNGCDPEEVCSGGAATCPADLTCARPPAPDLSDCTAAGRGCQNVAPVAGSGGFSMGNLSYPVPPHVYVAVTNKNELAQLDTETGQRVWQKPTHGVNPSRVAVALDGTAWVGNRCLLVGREQDFSCSSIAHLDANGDLICRGDVPGWVRGLAIDAQGDVVAGSYSGQTVWKVSGTALDGSQVPPRCQILGSVLVGVPVYGLAVDSRGFAWTASSPTKKVDLATMQVVATVANASYYGIAIDWENRVWLGGHEGGGNVHRIDGDPPYATLDVPSTDGVTAVALAPDGTVWGSSYAGSPPGLVKITLTADGLGIASVQRFADPEGLANHGVAVDAAGRIWSPQVWTVGMMNRWTPSGVRDGRFTVDAGQELYSYSDMTGSQLRSFTIRRARWTQQYDGGLARPSWSRIEWTGTTPPGSSIEVRARGADAPGDFTEGTASAWCGPTSTSPAALSGCAQLDGKRFLEVELALSTTAGRPTVSDVRVYFTE